MLGKRSKICVKIVIGIFLIFESQSGLYAIQAQNNKENYLQESSAHKKKRLNLDIAQNGVNKIAVEGDRIVKVIGNDKEYNIDGDSSSGIIFLTSNLRAGDMSPITIITEKGFSQDINLRITKTKEPVTIVIKKPILKEKAKAAKKEDLKFQVIEGIKEISSGNIRNYSFRKIDINTLTSAREPESYSGYHGLSELSVRVDRISEYSNRYIKIFKYEYEEKYTSLDLKEITKLFPKSIAVSERGNAIIVVYKQ